MRATVDNFGRIVVEADDGSVFYKTGDGRVMRETTRRWRDKQGKEWGTPERRRVREGITADRVRQAIDNYEPRETGDAWAGGFAPNH